MMKKSLFLFPAVFLFAAMFLGGMLHAETPAIPNASFEEAESEDVNAFPKDWRGSKQNFARNTDAAHSGKASFCWKNEDAKVYALSHSSLQGIQPGESYKISGWVKTENVRGGKATLCVEWSDENGKWYGGEYLRGVDGTSDWTEITGIARIPKNATSPHITCYGTNGAVGTAWFDDLRIETYIPPCIIAMTSDHYRAQTVGGAVRVRVGLSAEQNAFSVKKQAEMKLEILPQENSDSDKNAAALKPLQTLKPSAWFGDSVEFTLDSDPLPNGKYTLRATIPNPKKEELETAVMTLTKLESFPERKSYIDGHNRLIVDGKPFFPLGLYFHNPSQEDVERMGESPFNCIMSYAPMSRETLDALHKVGVKSIYSVKDYYEGLAVKTDEEGCARTIERINALKDHPAIIAWYINDELPITMKETLAAHRSLCESLDPGRPTWVVLYQIQDIREYIPTFDVIGTDPYPIAGKPASLAWDWSRRTNEAVFGFHANWQVPQYFNWQNYKPESQNDRTPTYEEMRAMTWMGIAGGANGIIGYSYFDFCRNFCGRNADDAAKKASFERTWKDVCRIGNEVKSYENILLSIETPAEITLQEGADAKEIAVRRYGYNGETWLLAVNSSEEGKTCAFILPEGASVKNAESWPEVKFTQEGRKLTVRFDALATAFLQIK